MSGFTVPKHTRSRIKSAGKRIIKEVATNEDTEVLENFRASHAYVLNTFQMNVRRNSRQYSRTVAQRLKRRNTIIDKLRREPSLPLYAMQDVAGCRVILANQNDLYEIRSKIRAARFDHDRVNDRDKYDYIQSPKATGYRGVHDVFSYKVSGAGARWNGLKVELQYRTRAQHAWATAVEVADLITSSRIKFSQASENYMRYFQLASEIIARVHEGQNSCCSELDDETLAAEFIAADKRLGLLNTLDELRRAGKSAVAFKTNSLLIFRFAGPDSEQSLDIESFENVTRAIERYDELEKQLGSTADIVLVRGETEESIRDAFRNYFSDARAFVDLIRDGINILDSRSSMSLEVKAAL